MASKGFEKESCLLPHQVASEVHPHNRHVGLFAGPTFANELATGLPSALCISTKNLEWGKVMAKALSNNVLRIYANDDPIGVGVGSAVKNVIAIACGFSDGIYAGNQTARDDGFHDGESTFRRKKYKQKLPRICAFDF